MINPEKKSADPRIGCAPTIATTAANVLRGGRLTFTSDGSFLAKGLRFGLVGIVSSLVFAAITGLLVTWAGFGEKLACVCGYMTTLPLNFVGHRSFSFRSQGALRSDIVRFCAVHAVNLAVTLGAMVVAVNGADAHYGFGVLGAVILVPITNFLLMNFYVFGRLTRQCDN